MTKNLTIFLHKYGVKIGIIFIIILSVVLKSYVIYSTLLLLLFYFILLRKFEYSVYTMIVLYIAMIFSRAVTVDHIILTLSRDISMIGLLFLLGNKIASTGKINKAMLSDRFTVLLILFIVWFIIVIFIHIDNLLGYLLAYREYIFGLMLYFVFLFLFIVYGKTKILNIIWLLLWIYLIIFLVSIFSYFQLLNFDSSVGQIYILRGSDGTIIETRTIAGIPIPRMNNYLGISTGGGGLIASMMFVVSFVMYSITEYKKTILLFALVFLVSGVLTASFTFYIVLLLYILFNLYTKISSTRTKLFTSLLIPLVIIIFINFMEFDLGYKKLSLLEYIVFMIDKNSYQVEDFTLLNYLIGKYIDLKTSLIDREFARDTGIFSIFMANGFVGFFIFLSMFFVLLDRGRLLLKNYDSKYSIKIALLFTFSPLIFLHGSGLTTPPLDLFFVIGAAYITYSYNDWKKSIYY